ncbi:hypothetical protein Apa02nite_025690 [Actinoplanes palleronii]|uniref:Uncharacterized protein n=1 Tax=Actinoplanes palleronii TaxID=113570 RepID=A0ABQ4B7Q0_9ACTN|nr:hypothetical protein Apa02nite_025690 [Actinoplanes palleronii]
MTAGGVARRGGAAGSSDCGPLKGARGLRARGVCFSSILRSVVASATFHLLAAFVADLREVSGRPLCATLSGSGIVIVWWFGTSHRGDFA